MMVRHIEKTGSKGKTSMKNLARSAALAGASLLLATAAQAATLQLDFDYDFSDQNDLGSELPDGPSPWATAVFDDGGSVGTVNLTFSVGGTVGAAEVTGIYLNSDIGGLSFTTLDDSAVSSSVITYSSNAYQAGNDGEFDILIDLPPPGADRLTAGESISYLITGAGITASTFNSLSNPTLTSETGPFLGAVKFASTGDGGENSAWVAAVPVPGAVWLMGSALGMLGWLRRKSVVSSK